jgi:hypothetical protein
MSKFVLTRGFAGQIIEWGDTLTIKTQLKVKVGAGRVTGTAYLADGCTARDKVAGT